MLGYFSTLQEILAAKAMQLDEDAS